MNRLKQVRQKQGLSQKELADALNLSQAAISGYETGKYDPGMKIWKQIADYFKVSVDYLIEDITEDKSKNPTGIPDEVYELAQAVMKLPPAAQTEARAYLDFLKQRYTQKKG
nr:MAG TPA: Repressor protein CI [Caudoviricetes sp.]